MERVSDPATSNARLRILAEVSHALAAITTDYASVLQTIADVCARLIGDGCLVTLVDDQQLVGVANAHRDLDLANVYREYVGALGGVPISGGSVSATVLRTGETVFVPRIDPALVVERSEPALQPLVARLDIHSYIVAPIRVHDTPIGTLSLMRTSAGRDYVQEDVVLLEDVADRAGLAIDNARLYKELEQRVQQRTAELETFSFAVAHSIRAPLRTIAAFSDALYEDAHDRLAPHSRDDLERIRFAVGRVRETVDSLVHLSNLAGTDLRRTTLDLSELAGEVVQRLRENEPGRVDVEIEPHILVHADPRLATLALSNLLSNAWQSTRSRSTPQVSVSADRSGRTLAILIRDNGNLTVEQAHMLLSRGTTSRTKPTGDFGVGLVIARQVIERHGGTIDIVSPEHGGTTVRFTLAS